MGSEIDAMFSEVPEEPKVEETPTTTTSYSGNRDKKFYIGDDNPDPTEFDFNTMGFDSKDYVVAGFGKVPYKLLEDIGALFKFLNSKDYILRSYGDTRDKLLSEAEVNSKNIKYYLPFKKYNPSVDAEITYPIKLAYDYSSNYAYKYENLPMAVKSFLAQSVHMLTGKECNKKANFVIIYTDCGKETDFKIDYNVTGPTISNLLKYATLLNIPVFNLKNEDALERIKNHVSG